MGSAAYQPDLRCHQHRAGHRNGNAHDLQKSASESHFPDLSGNCPDYAPDGAAVCGVFRHDPGLRLESGSGSGGHHRVQLLGYGGNGRSGAGRAAKHPRHSVGERSGAGHEAHSGVHPGDSAPDRPAADPAVHQPHHPDGENHQPRHDDRHCGGFEGCPADHRGQPAHLSQRRLRGIRGGILAVFPDLLAHQPSGGVLGEKVVITVENVLLSVRHLKKAFGDHVIFEDFDLDVREGEVVVVIGPSGCGKSTLLRCLNGLEPIQGGEILLEGEPVLRESKSITRMRQKIGMVFQSYELFPHKTILENILLAPMKVQKRPRSDVEKEALELLERVGLADRKNDYPRQLSGGQKQRVAIVRALCMHPEILLLDEITAALDPEMVREVLDVVLSLAKAGSTMVIVTHEMNFARAIADRILFIENGTVVEQSDDPKAFFASPETDRAKAFLKSFDYE